MHLWHFTYKNDEHLIRQLLAGNERAVNYVFYDHFTSLLRHNAAKAAGNKGVPYDDLVQELFLYLSANNWAQLRKYNPEMPFVNWFSVVSYRFFKDFSRSMIDSSLKVPISNTSDHLFRQHESVDLFSLMGDVQRALAKLKPPRDRDILEALIIRDEEPEKVAVRHNVTVDNLYNIKRRALAKLIKQHLTGYKN